MIVKRVSEKTPVNTGEIVLNEVEGCGEEGPEVVRDSVVEGTTKSGVVDTFVLVLREVFIVELSEAAVDVTPSGSPLPLSTLEVANAEEVSLPTLLPPVWDAIEFDMVEAVGAPLSPSLAVIAVL